MSLEPVDVPCYDPAVPRQGGTDPPPCARIVLRTSTERPEAVEAGYARFMGLEREAVWDAVRARAGRGALSREHPFGAGDVAMKIVDVLERFH